MLSTVTQPQSLAGEPKPCFKLLQAEATRDQAEAHFMGESPTHPSQLVIAQLFGERLSYTQSWGHSVDTGYDSRGNTIGNNSNKKANNKKVSKLYSVSGCNRETEQDPVGPSGDRPSPCPLL